jgi:hypothetical protein
MDIGGGYMLDQAGPLVADSRTHNTTARTELSSNGLISGVSSGLERRSDHQMAEAIRPMDQDAL